MNNNSTKQFSFLLLLFFAISLGVSYFTTDHTEFWSTRSLILSFIKALIFTLVFFIVVIPKQKKDD
jgi:hypothetical protein